MTRDEMVLRHGFYCGYAARVLGDESYALRWLGRAHKLTEADYRLTAADIQQRAVAAGKLGPGEDPFDDCMAQRPEAKNVSD